MASKKQQKCKGSQKKSSDENTGKLIRENMKCPVCMEVLLPPIYQCETGHNICSYCIEEVSECPLCKGDYGDTRNYFAEELVNSMSFPCKFEEYGCDKVLLGSELKDHQEECQFQPYRCPELACQEVYGLHQMGKHLDKHGFPVLLGDVQEASFDVQDDHFDRKTEYNPWRFKVHNTEFYIVSTRQKDGSWYFWTYCLGILSDSKKFSCEIIVYGNDKQCLFRGPVHSLRTQPDEIIDHGNCLILTDNMIKSMRQNGKIKSRVRLIVGKNWNNFSNKPPTSSKKRLSFKNSKKNPQKGKSRVLIANAAPPSYVPPSPTSSTSTAAKAPPTPKPFKSNAPQSLRPVSGSSQSASLLKAENSTRTTSSRTGISTNDTPRRPVTPVKKTRSESVKKIVKKASSKAIINKKGSVVTVKVSKEQEDFVLQMRETLRCPGCAEVILPPVHMCSIGHSCCLKCKLSRPDCAICRAPINQARNFFAEELLYKLYQKCMYEKLGCPVCLPSAQMRLHESTCDFAPFECPYPTCRKLIRPCELLEHLNSHDIQQLPQTATAQIEVPKHNPSSEPICALPCIVMKYGVGFLPVIARNPNGSWTFFVTSQDHKDYWFEISITKLSKVVAFQGPIVSLRMNQTEIEKNGMSLLLTETSVRSLKNQDKFSYAVKIFKNTETPDLEESLFGFYANKDGDSRPVQIELFANKRTSVTPKDDDDSSDDSEDEEERRINEISGNQSEETDEETKAAAQPEEEFNLMKEFSEETVEGRSGEIRKNTGSEFSLLGETGDFIKGNRDILIHSHTHSAAFHEVDDVKVEKDLADYEKLISISDTEDTVKKVKSMMLFGQEFEASFVEKPKTAVDFKDAETTAKPLNRSENCSKTIFPTISLGTETDRVSFTTRDKISSGSQTELLYKLHNRTSQTEAEANAMKDKMPAEGEPNALELRNKDNQSDMDLAAEASGYSNPKDKNALHESSFKKSLAKLEQIKGRQQEKRPERKTRSKLRKSLERLKKSVSSTSSSSALARPKDSKHLLPVTQSSKTYVGAEANRTDINMPEYTADWEEGINEVAAEESLISIESVKEEKKKEVGRTLLVAGNGNVTVVDFEEYKSEDEADDDYSSILMNSAADKVDKVVNIMNEGVEDVAGVVIDSLHAIKSGVDILGNLLISGTLEDSDTETERS